MAELKRIEEELPAAEVASYGIPQKQLDRPKLVKSQEPETLYRAVGVSQPIPLFSESEMGDFRSAVEQGTDRLRGRTTPDG
jgi:hypothetical protein